MSAEKRPKPPLWPTKERRRPYSKRGSATLALFTTTTAGEFGYFGGFALSQILPRASFLAGPLYFDTQSVAGITVGAIAATTALVLSIKGIKQYNEKARFDQARSIYDARTLDQAWSDHQAIALQEQQKPAE